MHNHESVISRVNPRYNERPKSSNSVRYMVESRVIYRVIFTSDLGT